MQHLLVVDDEAAICKLVQMAFEADGYCRVSLVSTSNDAKELARHEKVDAAIVDAVLPRMSGLALARELVELGVPVLIMTGAPEMGDTLERAGCPFLWKPFRINNLRQEIRVLINEAAQRRAELVLLLSRMTL